MKIVVSSTGKDLDSKIDPRFGRCQFFIVVETDDMSFESINNENIALGGGAGIQSAGFVASKGVKAVLTGNCGPKALEVFSKTGIDVFTGFTGTINKVVQEFKQSRPEPITKATVPEKAGVSDNIGSADSGRGMGKGGRCMGGSGRGRGMGGARGQGRGQGCGGGMGSGGGMGRKRG